MVIPIPIGRKQIHRYQYRYKKLLDTDTNTIIFLAAIAAL